MERVVGGRRAPPGRVRVDSRGRTVVHVEPPRAEDVDEDGGLEREEHDREGEGQDERHEAREDELRQVLGNDVTPDVGALTIPVRDEVRVDPLVVDGVRMREGAEQAEAGAQHPVQREVDAVEHDRADDPERGAEREGEEGRDHASGTA